MFKIIGNGSFANALHKVISSRGGVISNTSYQWIIPCVPSYALTGIDLEFDKKILFVSKGMIEVDSQPMLISEWADGKDYAVLAGPHLASELSIGLNTMSTIAPSKRDYFNEIKQYFPNPIYCKYVDFVELASVLKNIIAHVCGMYDAAGWGENAKACIIANSVNELLNIANHLRIEHNISDISQPGILGDLILTGTSVKSRNFKAGRNRILGKSDSELVESKHSSVLLEKLIGKSALWPFTSLAFDANQNNSDINLSIPWNHLSQKIDM